MAHNIPDNYIERREERLDDLIRFGGFTDAVLAPSELLSTRHHLLEAIRNAMKLAYESGYIHAVRDHQPQPRPLPESCR